MAVMLRLANVPSRVVLGYAHAVPNVSGQFAVSTFDAHAWVEAYFAGIGWVPFDPTPLAGISGGAANDLPWARHPKQTTQPIPGDASRAARRPRTVTPSATATRHRVAQAPDTGTSFVSPADRAGCGRRARA